MNKDNFLKCLKDYYQIILLLKYKYLPNGNHNTLCNNQPVVLTVIENSLKVGLYYIISLNSIMMKGIMAPSKND